MAEPGSSSDETLMQALSEGRLDCAAELFERYHRRLYNFFLHMTGDRPLSEDLTQSVFERLIRYRASYAAGPSFRSWIYQIDRNVRIDQLRKNRPRVSGFVDADTIGGGDAPVTRRLEKRETEQRLHRALRLLPEEQREVLVLTRFQELKYREVAALLHCSEGAVKVRVHRAIKELRTVYQKMEGK